MSEWAVTQTTRFKAAVSGAGMANLISEYGAETGPAYDEWFWGVPYEKPEGFLNSSPFLFVKNAKTPTLILQGEEDPIDPKGQSQELYRGLKRYGVESELVIVPARAARVPGSEASRGCAEARSGVVRQIFETVIRRNTAKVQG